MIYNNGSSSSSSATTGQLSHQAPTMSSTSKTSPRARHKSLNQQHNPTSRSATSGKSGSTATTAAGRQNRQQRQTGSGRDQADQGTTTRCRGRCRVQWSEQHVKEGLVLVQESQLARVVKTGPIGEHYEIDPKPFASGQWARVYKCRSRSTGIVYAAKYSSRSRFNADCSAELRHEIALLSLCSQSPRVVRLHDVYETPKEIIMVMEYAPGGDLQTLIDGDLVPLEGDVVHFVRQLVEGLVYLHERNIAHLDIKPQNLVMMGSFPDCNVKLCDFEISRVVLEGTEVREILGTPDYVAPEILHYDPITLAADMWSLGVTTYVLLTGFSPFGGETDQETFKNIILGQVDFPEELFEDVSGPARDFVAKLLVLEPSARMSAKQCLRHEWLRSAPTQASSHLRKYLSKSREVLLERVVSRENLRRAALLGQTANNGQLLQQQQQQQQQMPIDYNWIGMSQSEMCLSRGLNGSDGSSLNLAGSGSEDYELGASMDTSSSRTSLADSVSSSKSSLAMSQSCLLNKEQTEGLLNQAQDRRSLRASMAQGLNRIGLLSKIRSLNQVQSRSQACLPLLNGSADDEDRRRERDQRHDQVMNGNPLSGCRFDGSREKLYGLKSLSKSQGMLDIYHSLESLQRHRRDHLLRQKERSKTEDALPIFRHLGHGHSSSGSLGSVQTQPNVDDGANEQQNSAKPAAADTPTTAKTTTKTTTTARSPSRERDEDREDTVELSRDNGTELPVTTNDAKSTTVSEANMDSLQSLESESTLTDDSEETNASRSLTERNNDLNDHDHDHDNKQSSTAGSECHYDSEPEEPKYSVAQLVSAFNKHQEVASRGSLEAIMTEKRVADDSTQFPIGPQALRLFIPDIDITERKPLVRRKTSYKPRKNWEELRKQNEKNEGLLSKDFFNDSGNEDDMNNEDEENEEHRQHQEQHRIQEPEHDTHIDEKYKQCVEKSNAKKDNATIVTTTTSIATPPLSPASMDSGVNLRDILQKAATDALDSPTKEASPEPVPAPTPTPAAVQAAPEKRKRKTSTAKISVTDNNNKVNLASRISIFSSERRPSKSPTRHETKSRLAVKEKLCTGSYGRAMEKFSSKSNIDKHQQPRSRRTSATQIASSEA